MHLSLFSFLLLFICIAAIEEIVTRIESKSSNDSELRECMHREIVTMCSLQSSGITDNIRVSAMNRLCLKHSYLFRKQAVYNMILQIAFAPLATTLTSTMSNRESSNSSFNSGSSGMKRIEDRGIYVPSLLISILYKSFVDVPKVFFLFFSILNFIISFFFF